MPRVAYSRMPAKCHQILSVVTTALTGMPGNRWFASAIIALDQPDEVGDSTTTMPSACFTISVEKFPGLGPGVTCKTPGAISAIGRSGGPGATSSTLPATGTLSSAKARNSSVLKLGFINNLEIECV